MKAIDELFTNLSVTGYEYHPPGPKEEHKGTYLVFLESGNCPDTLAIQVSIPYEAWNMYAFGEYGPKGTEFPYVN